MANKKEIAIQLINVNKTFHIYDESHYTIKQRVFNLLKKNEGKKLEALKNINLKIYKGESIGIIGRNGSGKSTLTKVMSGTFIPDSNGFVKRKGTHLLLNLGVGFSHELTARENIYVNGSTLGLKIKQIDEIFEDIIAFAELENFIDTKIKYFSSGMIQRLSFSIALYANANIMFLDEVFAVGDQKFQKKATKVLENNWINGKTAVIVSHSTHLIQKYCDRTILMHNGEMVFFGKTDVAIKKYGEIN